jgi:glycerophosphoryl diester phosphodiesterase
MSARTVPELIAHRGLPRQHRENTLPGFIAATAAGAEAWELDVHETRDGVVVVHHDPVLPAAAGPLAGLAIASLDWTTLMAVTVGAAGERIPTLDSLLSVAGSQTAVYVEVKARDIEDGVLACLLRHPAVRTAVHSFDHRVARYVGAATSALPVGILMDSYLIDPVHALRSAGARDYWPHRAMVDEALVDAVHTAGGRVIVWTVNDPDQARQLASMGVDGLCTDVVDVLREALAP